MGRTIWACSLAGVGLGVSMLFAQSTLPATNAIADDAHGPPRWTTQWLVPTNGFSRLSVTDGVAGKMSVYVFTSDLKRLKLERTIDLNAAGTPILQTVEAAVPPEPPPATRPKEKVAERVYVGDDGSFQTAGNLTVAEPDLPLLVKEVAGPGRVLVVNGFNTSLADLVKARDRLRAAGVPEVAIAAAPNDPAERDNTSVAAQVNADGQFSANGRHLPDDAAVALFVKEIVGNRAIDLSNANGRNIPLRVMVNARDRLKAAGVKKVTVFGLVDAP